MKKDLKTFTNLLRAHLLKENLQLYRYLKLALVEDQESQDIVLSYRQEMQGIGKAVNTFVTKYKECTFKLDAERIDFKNELNAISPILVERINNEENILYPLYDTPDSY